MHKITGSHIDDYCKSKAFSSFKPHGFTAFVRELLLPENFLGAPRLLSSVPLTTGECKRLQQLHVHNYALKGGFFAQCTTFCEFLTI